jgi:alpha-galactosidase
VAGIFKAMTRLGLLAVFGLATLAVGGKAQTASVAATPPMGWNSWDAYGLTITEPQFRDNVKVEREKLLPFGWTYAVIDEGWFFENPQDRDTPDKLHYAIDGHGRYVPVPARFPSAVMKGEEGAKESLAGAGVTLPATIEETGFVALGAWVHEQGLKFGIHIVRGIPRASVERNLPVEGSTFTAQEVADTTDACPWDPTNWGVKDTPAGQAWYDSLLRQYASWGVDLLKVDCIADHPYKVDEIRMIRRAIDKTGRPMVLSLSPGPTNLSHAVEVGELATMWRIADDEWDVWDSAGKNFPQGVKDQFVRLAAWEPYDKPGNWPDADMLPLGELRPFPGWGKARRSALTPDEARTEVTLWAIARSPMILGANLTLLDDATLRLLTNKDVIAVNQTSTKSTQVLNEGGLIGWRAELPDGLVAVAMFNTGDAEVKASLPGGDLTAMHGGRKVRDVWAGKDLGNKTSLEMTLPAHGCALFLLR